MKHLITDRHAVLRIYIIVVSVSLSLAFTSPSVKRTRNGSTTDGSKIVSREGDDEVTYTAAVLEYEPLFNWTDETAGYGILEDNTKAFLEYGLEAKRQGADIMITPEYGIQTLQIFDYANDTETFLTFTQLVPDPVKKIVPCNYEEAINYFQTMKMLSCNVQELEMYLVIDLTEAAPCNEETVVLAPWEVKPTSDCPEDGYFFYNTQVVFNRNGEVIARYRKQHLYKEYSLTPGPADDNTAVFYADFNVLFSLQICFDIVFEDPGYNNIKNLGIRDIAMSTAWIDYLPFYLADSIQNSWSRGLQANLLVAGYHKPEKGKLGSGIYKAYAKELPEYTYNKDSGTVLILSNVTTISASALAAGPFKYDQSVAHFQSQEINPKIPGYSIFSGSYRDEYRKHLALHENLENYTAVLLNETEVGQSNSVQACNEDNFCCNLTYEYSGNLTYMFIVYSGQFIPGFRYPVGIQNCAVIWCLSSRVNTCAFVEGGLPDSDTFGPFTITSDSFTAELIYPGGNHRDLSLISNDNLQFSNNSVETLSIASSEPVQDLLFAALCGRWYSNDGFGD